MIARSRILILLGVSIIGLGGMMTLSSCTRGANLNVINRSTTELTNVVAIGSGFTQSLAESPLLWRIGSIPAGEQRGVSLNVRSESDLKLFTP